MKLNKTLLFTTILAGAMAFGINLVIYNALNDVWTQYPLIALMFAILAVFTVATVFIVSNATDQNEGSIFFLNSKGAIALALVVTLVVLAPLSMGLEWIYDRNRETISGTPTSYIFVLDESGSMYGNDPNNERYNAVNTVMGTLPQQTPYAVYMFATTSACAQPMAPYAQGTFVADTNIISTLGGGTAIRNALEQVLTDHQNGNFSTGGTSPRVILLSDGQSSDMNALNSGSLLSEYRKAGISISTVGLGYADASLMQQIAKKTGGSYISISNAQELATGFTTAATSTSTRNLFNPRDIVSSDLLYGVLRVLFLTVLGAFIALMKAVAFAKSDSTWLIVIVGAITSFVGALAVELLNLFGVHIGAALAVYCILVAITPARVTVVVGSYQNRQLYTGL